MFDPNPRPCRMICSDRPALQIFVVTLSGKTIEIGVDHGDSVSSIKEFIRTKTGFSPEQQRLFFEDLEMDENAKVWQYGITNESTLHVVFEKEFRQRRTIRV